MEATMLTRTKVIVAHDVDLDLAEQAKPGHGIPSQDPDPEAQQHIDSDLAEAEAKTVYVGGGVVAGAATGAMVGTAIAGPVGVVVGGTIGALAGAIGGAALGAGNNPSTVRLKEKLAR
jgi:hypothetical protein